MIRVLRNRDFALLWFAGGDWKRTKLLEDAELEQRVMEEARIEEGITT